MLTKPILKIIVPCYNEQDLLPVSCNEFMKNLYPIKVLYYL